MSASLETITKYLNEFISFTDSDEFEYIFSVQNALNGYRVIILKLNHEYHIVPEEDAFVFAMRTNTNNIFYTEFHQ